MPFAIFNLVGKVPCQREVFKIKNKISLILSQVSRTMFELIEFLSTCKKICICNVIDALCTIFGQCSPASHMLISCSVRFFWEIKIMEEEGHKKNKTKSKTYILYYLQETCLKILTEKSTIQNINRFLQKYRYLRYTSKHSLISYTWRSISLHQIGNSPKWKNNRGILIHLLFSTCITINYLAFKRGCQNGAFDFLTGLWYIVSFMRYHCTSFLAFFHVTKNCWNSILF